MVAAALVSYQKAVVPLCADCHRQAPGAYHWWAKREHGLSFAGIVALRNREWQARYA